MVSAVRNPTASNVYGLTIALSIICLVVVFLRFWARRQKKLGVQIDDWLSLVALVILFLIVMHAQAYE